MPVGFGEDMKKTENHNKKLSFYKLFWLFLIGSLIGVLMEGSFCYFKKGHWETHVVSILAPYNILYGLGAVVFYAGAVKLSDLRLVWRVLIMTLLATVLELLCGLLLRYGLGMRAWNYSRRWLNYKGIICLEFSIGWGIAALAFCLLYPTVDKLLDKFVCKATNVIAVVLTVLIGLDLCLTGVAIVRWSNRYHGATAETRIEQVLDETFPDEWMQNRFVEWRFLD